MIWKIRWKKNIKESMKENIVIFSLLFSLKNNEENKGKREGQGKFYRGLCSPLHLSLPLHRWLWLLTVVDPFNGHHNHSDHLPGPKTYPLPAPEFPWMKCALQIKFSLMKCIRIPIFRWYELNSNPPHLVKTRNPR